MSEQLGRDPMEDELAEEVGVAAGAIVHLKAISFRPASLNAPITEDGATELGEIVADTEGLSPFEKLRDQNFRDHIGTLLDGLSDREKKIIISRFGFDGEEPKTLEEVGSEVGVTRERTRQLQNIALLKLRKALQAGAEPMQGFAVNSECA